MLFRQGMFTFEKSNGNWTLIHRSRDRQVVRTLVEPALNGRDWRSALLVGGSVHFGVSRQYQSFAEMYSKDAIFHDEDAALKWLRR